MRRLQHFSFTTETTPAETRPGSSARLGTPASPPPRDEMWRSRRVASGSDWMSAWVQKPGRR